MNKLEEHPTVKKIREKQIQLKPFGSQQMLDADWLKKLCLGFGADDVGFVEVERPEIDVDRDSIEQYAPWTKTLVAFVCRMNKEPVRTTARSVANLEFHHAGDQVNEVAKKIVTALEEKNIRAINPSMGFPMEMDQFPGKIWVISHKLVAVAAGLGQIGIHRNVIHPRFGNFILLGTVLMEASLAKQSQPIDYNPCVSCKLCVAACPVGAIGSDGDFNFSSCYTHNYKEFMGGFTNWVETIADSKDGKDYRNKVNDAESASVWQSLSYGANYKAAYCMAVCPAGEDVMSPFLANRPEFVKEIVKPLQQKKESIYVVKGSDAEEHVLKRFQHKTIRHINNGLRPTTIENFLTGLKLTFQRNQSKGLNATYHFVLEGVEQQQATITIKNKQLTIVEGLVGQASIKITADSQVWVKFIRKEASLPWALIRRKIRIKGNPKLLIKFGKCFLA
ncbi:MAG: SCP2 sterol-binding domain-containing protein [Methylococcaceae bacterium]